MPFPYMEVVSSYSLRLHTSPVRDNSYLCWGPRAVTVPGQPELHSEALSPEKKIVTQHVIASLNLSTEKISKYLLDEYLWCYNEYKNIISAYKDLLLD